MIRSDDDLELDPAAPLPPAYTLDMEKTYAEIANPHWEPISSLDPSIYSGWVIIRHHRNYDSVHAYVDALYDTETYEDPRDRWLTFRTHFGIFSVFHRLPSRGTPNCMVVYTTKVADPMTEGLMDWHKVIGPDGQDLDIDALLPPDVSEELDPIMCLMNKLDE
jgi:hypothetical protein